MGNRLCYAVSDGLYAAPVHQSIDNRNRTDWNSAEMTLAAGTRLFPFAFSVITITTSKLPPNIDPLPRKKPPPPPPLLLRPHQILNTNPSSNPNRSRPAFTHHTSRTLKFEHNLQQFEIDHLSFTFIYSCTAKGPNIAFYVRVHWVGPYKFYKWELQ